MAEAMKIICSDGGNMLRERLRDRLESVGRLMCAEHRQPVVAVTIHGRENGWFDPIWTTCCPALETQARTILKDRC